MPRDLHAHQGRQSPRLPLSPDLRKSSRLGPLGSAALRSDCHPLTARLNVDASRSVRRKVCSTNNPKAVAMRAISSCFIVRALEFPASSWAHLSLALRHNLFVRAWREVFRQQPLLTRTFGHLPALIRAGFPSAVAPGGTSRVTTLPAPMMASSPIVTPGKMMAPLPIQTCAPMLIGRPNSSICRR